MTTKPNTSRTTNGPLGLMVGAAVVAALVAFLAGRLTGDAAPSRNEGRGASRETARAESGWASEPARGEGQRSAFAAPAARAESLGAGSAGPADAPRPASATPVVVPAQVAVKATEETRQQLEAVRHELVEKCWPARGLPSGRTTARVTFNLVYDASGRAIGRAISEERRAPAPELTRCLSRTPLDSFRVSPPGSNVGVNVAVNFP